MGSASGVQRRTRWAGLAVLALLPVAAVLAGCKSEPERVELPRPQMAARRSKEFWRSIMRTKDLTWASLQANCDVTISNPQIPTSSRSIKLAGGRLVVRKPGQVYLRVPESGDLRLKLVGDGQVYRAEMQIFQDAYAGTYDDPVLPRQARIHIMPADVVHAFCPDGLLTDRALVLTELERVSGLSAIQFVEDPESGALLDVRMAATIALERVSEAITGIEKYDSDGGIRARITYPRRTAVPVAEDRSVSVPTKVLIDYPVEQTRILLTLEDVKLNEPVDQSLFIVGP